MQSQSPLWAGRSRAETSAEQYSWRARNKYASVITDVLLYNLERNLHFCLVESVILKWRPDCKATQVYNSHCRTATANELFVLTGAKRPSGAYGKRWDGSSWAARVGRMRGKIAVQAEGLAISALFSKANRLVFSGTRLESSPKCLLPASAYHCVSTDSFVDGWAVAGNLGHPEEHWWRVTMPLPVKLLSDGAPQFMQSQSQVVGLKETKRPWKLPWKNNSWVLYGNFLCNLKLDATGELSEGLWAKTVLLQIFSPREQKNPITAACLIYN